MVATSRNAWFIPVGSFAVAMLLSLFAGPVGSVVARMPQQQTSFDPCHTPTKKDGHNDAGGKSDGKHFKTAEAGRAAESDYTIDVESFLRKPTGEVRYFAGAKNGSKVPGLEKKKNSSMRGWKFVHGATDCCHTATLETFILLSMVAHITQPTVAGISEVEVSAEAEVDQFADNCAEKRPLKKKISRSIFLSARRELSTTGVLIDRAVVADSASGGSSLAFSSGGFVRHQEVLENTENWFFLEKTHMEFDGTATITKVEAGPGAAQVAEGTAWVFKSSSRYSDADNGTINQCSN